MAQSVIDSTEVVPAPTVQDAESDGVQHHAISTPVTSDNEGHSEVEHEESDKESVVPSEVQSPANNDKDSLAEDMFVAPLSFGAAARAAMEGFDDVDLE